MVPLMAPLAPMAQIEKILEMMRREPENVSFNRDCPLEIFMPV
jgi:hypothetical protein